MRLNVDELKMESVNGGDVDVSVTLYATICKDSERFDADADMMVQAIRQQKLYVYIAPMTDADREEWR